MNFYRENAKSAEKIDENFVYFVMLAPVLNEVARVRKTGGEVTKIQKDLIFAWICYTIIANLAFL
jgi:hypothetical protein